MVRRNGKTKTRRRRDNRFKILDFAESVVYGSIITKLAFNTTLPGFLLEGTGAPGRSLRDIIANPEASFEEISSRLMNTENVLNAIGQSVVTGFTFRFLNKGLSRARQKVNKGMDQLGLPAKL